MWGYVVEVWIKQYMIRLECKGLSSSDQSSFLYLPEENAYFLYLPEENESQWRDFCAALNREDCPRIEGFPRDPHILWSSEPGEAGPQ